MTDRDPSWTFTITPLPSDVPAANRVRSALKVLLRRFGLRCTAVVEAPAAEQTISGANTEDERTSSC